MFHICFTYVSHMFYICFTYVLHMFYTCFTYVSHMFYICFTCVSHMFYICSTYVLHMCHLCLIYVFICVFFMHCFNVYLAGHLWACYRVEVLSFVKTCLQILPMMHVDSSCCSIGSAVKDMVSSGFHEQVIAQAAQEPSTVAADPPSTAETAVLEQKDGKLQYQS